MVSYLLLCCREDEEKLAGLVPQIGEEKRSEAMQDEVQGVKICRPLPTARGSASEKTLSEARACGKRVIQAAAKRVITAK